MKQHWEVSAQASSIIYVLWGYFSFINIANNTQHFKSALTRTLGRKRLLLSFWPRPNLASNLAVCFHISSVGFRGRGTAGRCWIGNKDRAVVIPVLVNGTRPSRACTVCVLSLGEGAVLSQKPWGQSLILRSYLDTLHLNGFEQDWCPRILCVWSIFSVCLLSTGFYNSYAVAFTPSFSHLTLRGHMGGPVARYLNAFGVMRRYGLLSNRGTLAWKISSFTWTQTHKFLRKVLNKGLKRHQGFVYDEKNAIWMLSLLGLKMLALTGCFNASGESVK